MKKEYYAIMRFQKHKIGDLSKLERHHEKRETLKHRANPHLEKYNKHFKRNNTTLLKNVKNIVKEQEKRTNKKVRKDANVIVEFVFTFSPEAEGSFDIYEWDKQNKKFLFDMFGKENILRYDIEFDEATPHVHAFVCPRNSENNICFKSYVSNKHDIEDMQTDYAKLMKPFGLKRGKPKNLTKAFHKPISQFYLEEQKKAEQQANDIINRAIAEADEMIKKAIAEREKYLKECHEIAENVFDDLEL